MPPQKHNFHDGKKGIALAIRVIPRASKNEISQILNDGTIQVRLSVQQPGEQANDVLVKFFAELLEVSTTQIEIVAGEAGKDKIVSILDMDAQLVNQRIQDSSGG